MVFPTRLGMELLALMVSKPDTALTRPFCSFHGIVHTLPSMRYDLTPMATGNSKLNSSLFLVGAPSLTRGEILATFVQ
jgi:hypothetical protein